MKGLEFGWTDLGGLGLLGLAIYGGIKLIQLSSIGSKLDMSIKELSASTPVDIQKSMVDRAVERAVDREVHKAVADTARRVGEEVRGDLRKEVKTAVQSQYSDISDRVTKQVAKEVSDLRQDDIVKRITDRAEDLVVDRINEETRKAAAKFGKGMDGFMDLYGGFARWVASGGNSQSTGNQGRSFTVSL